MTSPKIRQYLTLTCKIHIPKLQILIKIVNKNLKNMAVIQPRPTHILYQCAKFGLTCKRPIPIFWYFISQLLVEISI